MHPLVALLIAMVVATLILGAFTAILSLRDVPEAYEDDEGFWAIEDDHGEEEITQPVPVRVLVRNRTSEQEE